MPGELLTEHPWYTKHSKDVAAAIKKAKGAPKEEALPCALVRMPDQSHVLCILVSPAKTAALVKEAKKAGGKVLSEGRLYKGEGGPTFAVDTGDVSVKAKFAQAAAAVGAPLTVIIESAVPPAGEAPPPDAAGFKDRMKTLLPRVQEAGRKAPQRKAALDQLAAQAVAAAKANDLAQANSLADQLDAAASEILKGAGQTGAPPPPPPPPPSKTDDSAFKARMKEVLPLYQQAVLRAPDQKAALDQLAAQAASAARAGDFPRALELAEQLADASAKAGVRPQETDGAPPPPDAPTAPVVDAAAFKARLKEVLPLYKEAAEKAPDRRDELTQLATQASAAGQAKNFAEAVDLLDQLEARSNAALRAAAARTEAEGAIGKGGVQFRKRMIAWRSAKAKAASAVAKLKKEILGDHEAASLSNWEEVKRGTQALADVVQVFDELDDELDDALEAIDEAGSAKERDDAKADALEVVRKYQKELDDPFYDLIDGGPYGTDIKVKAVIASELNNLAAALA